MACRSCRLSLGFLSLERSFPRAVLSKTCRIPRIALANAQAGTRRRLHGTATQREGPITQTLKKVLPAKALDSYSVYTATDNIYKICASQATYNISPEHRTADNVPTTEDGEEIGMGAGVWHDDFNLLPTFSTWSQVTMLHMYLILVRVRCLEKEAQQAWQRQLVDHFFYEADDKMRVIHVITSHSTRQKYLKDVFVQWRGLILAYDEGLVKGDAVLAGAIWRNLYKGQGDVDFRHLAAIVSWMRQVLKNLDLLTDEDLVRASDVFKRSPKSEFLLVDQPSRAMEGALGKATVIPNTTGV